MGCVHGKCFCCCTRLISDVESEERGDIGPNSTSGILENHRHILTESSIGLIHVPSHNFHLQYSFLTQRGYYPDSPEKENQDCFCIRTLLQGNPNLHFFGVFDGHGQFGTQCSNFVGDRLVDILSSDPTLLDDPVKAYNSAFLATNSQLHDSEIDDSMSGTTAITILVHGDAIFVANVGDSRAVMGVRSGGSVLAENLSSDQTPFRKDEYDRVKRCGARVLTVDQVEGLKDPAIQSWGDEESDEGDPPRLWVQNGMYPGTAFTRSLGDATAEKIGVIAVPEVSAVNLTEDHLFFVIASDGVFEFLGSQVVVDMVVQFADPRDACAAIAAESYRKWLEHENRTDDITIIIVHIKDLCSDREFYLLTCEIFGLFRSGCGDHQIQGLDDLTMGSSLFAWDPEPIIPCDFLAYNLSVLCGSINNCRGFLGLSYQSGASVTDRKIGSNTNKAPPVAEKGSSKRFVCMKSEDYLSMSGRFSDLPTDRNSACVAPSPTRPKSSET